jgi:hypothetical protein
MNTSPSVSPATITEDHPSLNTLPTDHQAVLDGPNGPEIAPSYLNLSCVQQRYVLALWRAGEPTMAQRVAGCYRSGTIFQVCPNGAYAKGYKHRCGDPLCTTCCRPRYRFYAWAVKRDHSIFHRPCVGLELFGVAARETLIGQVREFVHDSVSPDAVFCDAFQGAEMSVRVIVPLESVDRKTLQRTWRGQLSVKRGDPAELWLWAFDGMRGAACLSAEDKATLRISLIKARLIRTIGTLYSPLPKAELAKRRKDNEHNPGSCPICKEHEPLETIPLQQRHEESVASAEARFVVDWMAEHESTFFLRKGSLTHKSQGGDDPATETAVSSPSPPH